MVSQAKFISKFMPIFSRFNNYIESLIQSLYIVRNLQNSIETRGKSMHRAWATCGKIDVNRILLSPGYP